MHDPENEQREARLRILTQGLGSEEDWPLAACLINDGYVAGSYLRNNLGASRPLSRVTLGALSEKGHALVETLRQQRKQAARQRIVMRCVLVLATLFVGLSLEIGLSRSAVRSDETRAAPGFPRFGDQAAREMRHPPAQRGG